MPVSRVTISLPQPPKPPKPVAFPILALVAPIIAAAMMWALTRSPFVLVFAILGPVIALATMGDSVRRARGEVKQERQRFEEECAVTLREIDDAHIHERKGLEQAAPCASALVLAPLRDTERWRADAGGALLVRVGVGRISSAVQLDDGPIATGGAPRTGGASRTRDRIRAPQVMPAQKLDELRERAKNLDDAPVVVDVRFGIGVYGAKAEALAVATSIIVQLATALSPVETRLVVTSDTAGSFQWTRGLPHSAPGSHSEDPVHPMPSDSGLAAQVAFLSLASLPPIVVSIADEEHVLPRECRVVITVSGSRGRVVHHPDRHDAQDFVPDFTSDREARRGAETLRVAALNTFDQGSDALPDRVALRDLWHINQRVSVVDADADADTDAGTDGLGGERSTLRDSLASVIGVGGTGPISVDLVKDGPHAIVGGTTGSGKSEVLVSWILAIAARYPPTHVNFLLVDFKGGAAFAPVEMLPHTAGILTDLDEVAAKRAILSLQAELRRRERMLAAVAARSIEELADDVHLPRLVIVVDEFAAMTASFPEMHDLFADLAARGRSLGIHLILCTQRPAGTMRDAVLANCALRVSLRVNNGADSVAVVGTSEAAKIRMSSPGRGLLLRGGGTAEPVQWALADGLDARDIAALSRGTFVLLQRPWLDPLPHMLDRAMLPPASLPGLAFGLVDIPEEQRRDTAIYDPVDDGNLFVLGGHRSGKSTALSTLSMASPSVVSIPSHPEGAWDVMASSLSSVRKGCGPSLVMVDDLDLVVSKFDQEYETEFIERLLSLVREGPKAGTHVVISASAVRGRVQAVLALCASTLVLRMRDRQEHVLVGGEASDFSAHMPPGGGRWQGNRVQVCYSPSEPAVHVNETSSLECAPGGTVVVISRRPESLRDRLKVVGEVTLIDAWKNQPNAEESLSVGGAAVPHIIVGDPDAWLSSPMLFGSLRSGSPLVFHDCSLAEFHSLARIRLLPPPVESAQNIVVVLHPDGRMHRAALPV